MVRMADVRHGMEADMKMYHVTLTGSERAELVRMISVGKASAAKLTRARVLLKADEAEGGPAWTDERIAEGLDCHVRRVERTRERFVEQGLELAINGMPSKRRYRRKLDGEAEAKVITSACSTPPEGHARWSLRLLADRAVALGYVKSISHETVRQAMKKTSSSRG